MKINSKAEDMTVRLWRQVYQTYTLLKKCEDQIFEEYGLTTEQYAVLSAIDYFNGPVKVTDVALWLERSTNSISMLVDRMVKAGLIRRVRDRVDRRVVYLFNTSKGENALKPATVSGLNVIRKIMSPLSLEERSTFLSLLGTIKYEMLMFLNPGMDLEGIKKKELKQAANLKKWMSKYGLPSTSQAKRQGSEKRKTMR